METKEIVEVNKLIGEFMEHSFIAAWNKSHAIWGKMGSKDTLPYEKFKYHSSWDALIPVFHKIQNIDIPDSDLVFKELFNMELVFNNIKWLLHSCVEFIKWYNGKFAICE
jgi:hypothetical protein